MAYLNDLMPSENTLGNLGKLGGAASDVWSGYQNFRNAQQGRSVANTLISPGQLAQYTNKLYQPLSEGALKMVNRDLNANLGARGVSQGGYANQFAADALARLETQRQNDAQRQAMAALSGVTQQVPYMPMNALGGVMKNLAALDAIRRGTPSGAMNLGANTPGGVSGNFLANLGAQNYTPYYGNVQNVPNMGVAPDASLAPEMVFGDLG